MFSIASLYILCSVTEYWGSAVLYSDEILLFRFLLEKEGQLKYLNSRKGKYFKLYPLK